MKKVQINGFWYYDEASTPLTTETLPAVDNFDIDVLVLPSSATAHWQIDTHIDSFFSTGVTHTILKHRAGRPNSAVSWANFDTILDSNEYGILATNPFANWINGQQYNADDIPTSTYEKIISFIARGGSLFIFSDHSSVFRNQVGLEGIIPELGGIVSGVDGTALDSNNVRSQFLETGGGNNFTLNNTAVASDLGIVASPGFGGTLKSTSGGRVIDAASRGIPLAQSVAGFSSIHGWFGKLGHLNSGIKGNIIWFGDINFQGALGTRIMNPLLSYIEKTN
jgi:hypothetical protein